jgi:hypothetical protein
MRIGRVTAKTDGYKHYKEENSSPVSQAVYVNVIKEMYRLMLWDIIVNGLQIVMPERLGTIQVCKYPSKESNYPPKDFKTTHQVYGEYNKGKETKDKKWVYYTNRHTDKYTVKVVWSKASKAAFKNKSKWHFKFCRPNIRPNSYNKHNPEVSLVPFILQNGVDRYAEYVKFYA